MNNQMNDLATALTDSIASDGQTPITADIPFGGNKITDLADGTADDDAVTLGQLDGGITSGSFTGTLTGGTTSPTVTVSWYRIGDLVTMRIPAKAFTSNAATFTITGGPSALGNSANWSDSGQVPSTQFPAQDGGGNVSGVAYVNTNGTIVLMQTITASNGWTNTATQKGIGFSPFIGVPISGVTFSYVIV